MYMYVYEYLCLDYVNRKKKVTTAYESLSTPSVCPTNFTIHYIYWQNHLTMVKPLIGILLQIYLVTIKENIGHFSTFCPNTLCFTDYLWTKHISIYLPSRSTDKSYIVLEKKKNDRIFVKKKDVSTYHLETVTSHRYVREKGKKC
jgi:hypothetical protein